MHRILLLPCLLLFYFQGFSTANYVYHEQTNNFVANPVCPLGGTDTGGGKYVQNSDKSGNAGFQIYAAETYYLHFKVEFQFYTNQVRVYYTTDGSTPSAAFGTPSGSTQVAVGSYTWTYSDQNQSCQIVDIVSASIPPQPAGTTVKYIISAWHSGGGDEIFANSGSCGGCGNCNTSGCATVYQYNTIALPLAPLIISEFRTSGSNGANDEFIEIYNNGNADITVDPYDGSGGYALIASDGTTRFTIPTGTIIPGRGHYLGINSTGYSLGSYPSGNGTTATGDATYTTGIADNAGIALFRTTNPTNLNLSTRMDAVGSSTEANTLYKEGTGYSALNSFNFDHSFFRKFRNGFPVDEDNNATDFYFGDPQGTFTTTGQRLAAAGPENLSAPINKGNSGLQITLADPKVNNNASPNYVRDNTSDPGNNSYYGTVSLRLKIKNISGGNITRIRFRIDSISTFPTPSNSFADLRVRSSSNVGIIVSKNLGGSFTALATTLETPPAQPNGGGFNSSLSMNTVTLANPLANGDSVFAHLLFGVQQDGAMGIVISPETLPTTSNTTVTAPLIITGSTLGGPLPVLFSNFRGRSTSSMVNLTYSISGGQPDHYDILRSNDGIHFEKIGTQKALNNNPEYSFNDPTPYKGNNFYKIGIVSIDGKIIYSTVLNVIFGNNAQGINLIVNSSNSFTINLFNLEKGNYDLKIFSTSGQQVYEGTINHSGQNSTQIISTKQPLLKGSYILRISNGDQLFNKQFLIIN